MILNNECYVYTTCSKYRNGRCFMDGGFCQKLFRIDRLYDNALLSKSQKIRTVIYGEEKDEKSFDILNNFSKDMETFVSEGRNVYLYSETPGNGKTMWSIRLLQNYINSVWYKKNPSEPCALFINVPNFLIKLKESISIESEYIDLIKNNVENVDIVVWDDIGTKVATEFETEHLLSMINSRIDKGKSNIYTSNISPSLIGKAVGTRLGSRLTYSTMIEFKGSDKRSSVAN